MGTSATVRSVVIGIFCAVGLAAFVWPTPWREEIHPSGRYRVNRFTGTWQVASYGRWKEVPAGQPTDPEIDGP